MSDEHFDEKIQVADKRNASDIICAICQSLIFRKLAANYAAERPIELPLPFQKKSSNEQFEQEMVSNWWFVNNMYEFENIGFTKEHNGRKFLACADCEVGPIGIVCSGNEFLISANRVKYK